MSFTYYLFDTQRCEKNEKIYHRQEIFSDRFYDYTTLECKLFLLKSK